MVKEILDTENAEEQRITEIFLFKFFLTRTECLVLSSKRDIFEFLGQ